jgi:single-stranded DNA-binding protein
MIEVHISGRLTAAPETRISRAGKPYVMARLACPNGSDRDGKERSDYITLFAYGEAAEKLTGAAQNSTVSAIGRLEASVWQPPNGGDPRADLKVQTWQIMRLGAPKPRNAAEGADSAPQRPQSGQPNERGQWGQQGNRQPSPAPSRAPAGYEDLDDDIPF